MGADLRVQVTGGVLAGAVTDECDGDRPLVLLLHGGPGLSLESLAGADRELAPRARIATFQQRGWGPSTVEGPFDLSTAVEDVCAVLRELDEAGVVLAGHSWGAHLALSVAARGRLPEGALAGVLCLDLMPGGTGEGGMRGFQAALAARTPLGAQARAAELAERRAHGRGGPAEAQELFALMWPAYFSDPSRAPSMPAIRLNAQAYARLLIAAAEALPALEAALADITVPVQLVRGADSPVPAAVTARTAERLRHAVVEEVSGAGHFFWLERPGTAGQALGRLLERCLPHT